MLNESEEIIYYISFAEILQRFCIADIYRDFIKEKNLYFTPFHGPIRMLQLHLIFLYNINNYEICKMLLKFD